MPTIIKHRYRGQINYAGWTKSPGWPVIRYRDCQPTHPARIQGNPDKYVGATDKKRSSLGVMPDSAAVTKDSWSRRGSQFPAANAGLQKGDIIISLDGKPSKTSKTYRISSIPTSPGRSHHRLPAREQKLETKPAQRASNVGSS